MVPAQVLAPAMLSSAPALDVPAPLMRRGLEMTMLFWNFMDAPLLTVAVMPAGSALELGRTTSPLATVRAVKELLKLLMDNAPAPTLVRAKLPVIGPLMLRVSA